MRLKSKNNNEYLIEKIMNINLDSILNGDNEENTSIENKENTHDSISFRKN